MVEPPSIQRMRVVERALTLLEVLAGQTGSVGVLQLSEQLGLPPSTLHRLLAVLARRGYVTQDAASRRYRLGPAVLRVAQAFLSQNPLVATAQPHLARLRSATHETVFLTAWLGDDAVCVATAESPRPLQFFMRVGQRMPYHGAASARAILAYRPAPEIERLLRREVLERFTASTPSRVEDVMADLARVRQQGYTVCNEEMEVGVTAIAAPVRDASGEVVASVTVVGPSERLAGEREPDVRRLVLATSAEISHALGYWPAGGDGRVPGATAETRGHARLVRA